VLVLSASAGATLTLYVNLVTSAGQPVAAGSDTLLSITCQSYFATVSGSLETPAAGSWCGQGPTVSSEGSGVYLVRVRPQFFP
jgi:hypothetical protein